MITTTILVVVVVIVLKKQKQVKTIFQTLKARSMQKHSNASQPASSIIINDDENDALVKNDFYE